jgi:RHS repeat-associated protein
MTYHADNELYTVDGLNVTEDGDGNMTYGPLTNDSFVTYAFDARNRLLNVDGITNTYDAMNNRIMQTYGTNSVVYIVNPNATLPQVLVRIKNGVTNYYVYGPGLLYQVTEATSGTNTLTYHYDSRGSTIALTADNGLVVDRFEYSLYATLTYRAGTDDTPFLFNGRYSVMTDPNSLLYMRARYYNPYICRFLNSDPSGFLAGLNFYAYANGNPVSYEDPLGLQPTPADLAIGPANTAWPMVSDAQWNSEVQAVNQQALAIQVSVGAGATVGAGGAAVITAAAPAAYSGLVWAGLSPAAASATVTTTLYVGGTAGGLSTIYNTVNDAEAGNINGVAFDLGTLGGAGFVGGVGGGRYIADNTSPSPSTVPYSMNPFTADAGYGFVRNPDLPLTTDLGNWLGTGPTPSSGGGAATLISSGIGTSTGK